MTILRSAPEGADSTDVESHVDEVLQGGRGRRWPLVVGAAVCVAMAGAAGWAGAQVLEGPDQAPPQAAFTTVAVTEGEIGESMTLNAAARWAPHPTGINRATGIVTSVDVRPGDRVAPGQALYDVDERPVVAASGQVPAYRDMAARTRGEDVAQLQRLLVGLGYLDVEPDGEFSSATSTAVRAWQRDLGVAADGVVRVGDVVFLPESLPARLMLDDDVVQRGARLSGDEAVVSSLPKAPAFTVPLAPEQADAVTDGTEVRIAGPEGDPWPATVAGRHEDTTQGTVVLELRGADGAAICADQCAQVPVAERSLLSAEIITVPTVEGLVVPSAALKTDADGGVVVVDAHGAEHPVTVVASAKGMAVIDGVEPGLRVRAPAEGGA